MVEAATASVKAMRRKSRKFCDLDTSPGFRGVSASQKVRRETFALRDVICDKRTEMVTRKPLCLPSNSLGVSPNGPS